MQRKIAVVGGGAAGLMASIMAARAGAAVTLYERNDRVGKKILATGNGRCNFSNESMGPQFYHGSGTALVEKALAAFGTAQAKGFFEELGMRVKEREGCLYPATGQAATVLDILRHELARQGVALHTECKIAKIRPEKHGFSLFSEQGGPSYYDAVILACGGCAAPNTGSDGNGFSLAKSLGHRIIPPAPALTSLRCRESFYKQLAGVRCDAEISLYVEGAFRAKDRGELQLADYGISGIPVFQLSRHAARALQEGRRVRARISFLPDFSEADAQAFFQARLGRHGADEMEVFLTGIVNKKISGLLLKLAGIGERERAAALSPAAFEKLWRLHVCLETEILSVNGFDKAQVTSGGVDCREVDASLMSKMSPGLFFAGELLDVDGICGGYNLQWAFASGVLAGRAAAEDSLLLAEVNSSAEVKSTAP